MSRVFEVRIFEDREFDVLQLVSLASNLIFECSGNNVLTKLKKF